MSTAPSRPRGRRPGHDNTKGMIRQVAARLFSEQGYDRVSLRGVAREADVDPALVHHYFDSKADLYCQAQFNVPWDPVVRLTDLLSEGTEKVGRRTARLLLDYWSRRATSEVLPAQAFPDAETSNRALAEMMAREVFTPIAHHFGHANAALRGQLATAALLGVLVGRHQLGMSQLSSVRLRQLVVPLGHALQKYLVEAW